MSDNSEETTKQAVVPEDAVTKFSMPEPVVLRGEDPSAYQRMLDQVRTAVTPTDFIEEAWVHDIADLLWDLIRLKRLKVAFINGRYYQELLFLLPRLPEGKLNYPLVDGWFRRDPDAVQIVDETLARSGRSTDDAGALLVPEHLKTVDAFDRMIAAAESRRSSVLKEIDRRRAAFALAMRLALKPIEDAEFTEVDQRQDRAGAG